MTTHFQNGITNVAKTDLLGQLKTVSPLVYHTYFNDFDAYVANDWTITSVGAATAALADVNGGVLLLTNAAADDNSTFFNKKGESFLLTSGKKTFFQARFAISDATQSDFVMGLQITDTTPLDVTDGIYFLKADGSTSVSLISRKDATTGSLATAGVATMVANTYIVLGFAYDGKTTLSYMVDGTVTGSVDIASYFPDTELTVSFGVQNGEAVAKTMSVDYIFAAQER
jgi:hypothetical protein